VIKLTGGSRSEALEPLSNYLITKYLTPEDYHLLREVIGINAYSFHSLFHNVRDNSPFWHTLFEMTTRDLLEQNGNVADIARDVYINQLNSILPEGLLDFDIIKTVDVADFNQIQRINELVKKSSIIYDNLFESLNSYSYNMDRLKEYATVFFFIIKAVENDMDLFKYQKSELKKYAKSPFPNSE
jgi:hypothetical protein